jgi:hypothetical protein
VFRPFLRSPNVRTMHRIAGYACFKNNATRT